MNKNFKFYTGIWAVLFVLFQVIVFVTPGEIGGVSKFESGSFWVGYVFITLAFIGQLAVAYYAFKAENLQKLFYNLPLISTSWSGLALTTIIGGACMLILSLPIWLGVIACLVVLGFNVIALIKAGTAADIVSKIDDQIKAQTFFVKSLTVDAEGLMARAKSDEIKADTKKVYEAVRYSDPMSNEALASVESQITLRFAALSDAVAADDAAAVKAAADELVILIGDRNKKCKLLK